MTIESIRFRNEGALVVLQVCERTPRGMYESRDKDVWRDATTEDLLHVANYTRAYDTLSSEIASIRRDVANLQPPPQPYTDPYGPEWHRG